MRAPLEKLELQAARMSCSVGQLDVLGQTVDLAWFDRNGLQCESLLTRSVVVADSRASTMWTALECAHPALSLESLMKMSTTVKRVCLALGSDTAAANLRMRAWVLLKVTDFNSEQVPGRGKLMVLPLDCGAHLLNRIVTRVMNYTKIIPRCFAVAFTLRFGPRFNRLLAQGRCQPCRTGFAPRRLLPWSRPARR
jgi:hypothetical protein